MSHKFDKTDVAGLKAYVDIHYLLKSLGFTILHENDKELRSTCIIHGGDNPTAFRFNKHTRTWVCFTHKCQETYGYDIIGLIRSVLNVDFITAVRYLSDLVGDTSKAKVYALEAQHDREKQEFVNCYSKPTKPDYVSEEALNKFKYLRSNYFITKGFKPETLDFFEIAGGYTDKDGLVRDIIPIRNEKNELLAYSLRVTNDKYNDCGKKYIFTPGFQKDKVLYNLNNARIFSTQFPLILVEGYKSVWKLHEYGIYNVVAVMGSMLTLGQLNLLKAYALKGVVFFFDPDDAGRLGMDNSCKMVSPYLKYTKINMDSSLGEDPAELTLEQAYGYLHEYCRG